MTRTRTCSFCNAEEGKLRPLGRFKVELTEVEDKNGNIVLACQSCVVHHREKFDQNKSKKSLLKKIQQFFSSSRKK